MSSVVERFENLGRTQDSSVNGNPTARLDSSPLGNGIEAFHGFLESKKAVRDMERKASAQGFHRPDTGELDLSFHNPPKANSMMLKKAIVAIDPEDLSKLKMGQPTKNGIVGHLEKFRNLVIWLHADAFSQGCYDIVSLEDHKDIVSDLAERGLSINLKEEEKHILKAVLNLGKTMREEDRDYVKSWDELDLLITAKKIGINVKEFTPIQEKSTL